MTKPAPIYQIRVALIESEPEVWRRVLIPSDIKLPKLHLLLQVVMGWRNCHLHRFRDAENSYGPMPDAPTLGEKNIKLGTLLKESGEILEY